MLDRKWLGLGLCVETLLLLFMVMASTDRLSVCDVYRSRDYLANLDEDESIDRWTPPRLIDSLPLSSFCQEQREACAVVSFRSRIVEVVYAAVLDRERRGTCSPHS